VVLAFLDPGPALAYEVLVITVIFAFVLLVRPSNKDKD
jgi:hypothetical protein